ncbi:hypothetical protein KDD30_07165 [Photobacterium sp. GJ3]|uniref:hypothetical protein n=1 Tax=Photobacterium sp. GJ3 TaxID=2829502 RepID=UPI001B8BE6D8|nr:hypothetical protein [Photobacterium sp. GJ3]QUJ68855.1 hypothetical protein KDD30_07165 [Photobacterium sp. GJ3]
MNKFTYICASAALMAATSAYSNDYKLSLLDFNSMIDNGDIIFVPFKKTTRGTGYVWFRDYQYDYLTPAPGEYRTKTLKVNFVPRSIQSGEFDLFVRENNISPNRETIVPEDAVLCEPTQAVTQLLMTFEYASVSTLPPGYPKLCSLVIRYNTSAEKEARLLALVDTKQFMHAKFALYDPNKSAPGVYIEVPTIVSQLVDQKILEQDLPLPPTPSELGIPHIDIGWYGLDHGINFYSSHIDPTLYGIDDGGVDKLLLFQRWIRFIELFQPVLGQPGYWVIPDEHAEKRIVISEPLPSTPFIEVSY